ncbi:MAG: glycoside hydrolase family 97 N-terminal domain-containing protein [Bacteroidota bacterium]
MKKIAILALFLGIFIQGRSEEYTISSPDKNIQLTVKTTDKLYYKVQYKGKDVIWYSPLSMTLADGRTLGKNPKVNSHSSEEVNETINTVWGNRAQIKDHYQELRLKMSGNYSRPVCRGRARLRR